jgi:6-phosphogluconolactonase
MSAMRNRSWSLLPKLLMVVLLCGLTAQAAESTYRVFVGTYTDKQSKGIYTFEFNPADGKTTTPELAATTDNPSFLAVDKQGKFLYSVNENSKGENKSGGVTVFAIDGAQLKELQTVPSMGADPAYLTLDKTGHYLLVANYTGGNIAVYPVGADGKLGKETAFIQHKGSSVNKERQEGPHAHSIQMSNDDRFALSADLGMDEVLAYRFDSQKGTLTPANPAFAKVEAGSGPRHVAFAPNGKFVYVTNEMASTVTTFTYDPKTAAMKEIQSVATLPAPMESNSTAEITTDAKGKNLYVSNRGEDTIAHFSIDPKSGKLTFVDRTPTGGKTPRFFTLDPTGKWMFVENQDSNVIFLFKVDETSGKLTATGTKIELGAPVCLVFVKR